MRTSLNPLMYKEWQWSRLFDTPGTFTVPLSAGRYELSMRGAGGAGGTKGASLGYTAGNGGAGGTSALVRSIITVPQDVLATVYVGQGGLTKANGGNGGNGGTAGSRYSAGSTGADSVNSCGGGGGYPTYIKIGSTYYYALGGGGGGGGGGASGNYRYVGGAGGGGGGGFYRLNTTTGEIISVPGQPGAAGGRGYDYGTPASAGVAGNITDFPTLSSGKGGNGNAGNTDVKYGGASALGGGASGGGGGNSDGNAGHAVGGGGGGGAGGDLDAGGGGGGGGAATSGSGSNAHTTPTASTDYQGNVSNLGSGGGQNQNGYSGWLFITKLPRIREMDLGAITGTVTETKDCDSVDGTLTDAINAGNII